MPCIECTEIQSKENFDVFSGRSAGMKFQALISPMPGPRNFCGGRLLGVAIADRADGSSYYYYEPNWTESDDKRVRALLVALHDLAANWQCLF